MKSYTRDERNEIGAAIYGALHAMDDSVPWERLPDDRRKWYRDAAAAAIAAADEIENQRWRRSLARTFRINRTSTDEAA